MTADELSTDVAPPFPNRERHLDPCPACSHALGVHAAESGCFHGWRYDADGHVIPESNGCRCPLALAGDHRPPKELDL